MATNISMSIHLFTLDMLDYTGVKERERRSFLAGDFENSGKISLIKRKFILDLPEEEDYFRIEGNHYQVSTSSNQLLLFVKINLYEIRLIFAIANMFFNLS